MKHLIILTHSVVALVLFASNSQAQFSGSLKDELTRLQASAKGVDLKNPVMATKYASALTALYNRANSGPTPDAALLAVIADQLHTIGFAAPGEWWFGDWMFDDGRGNVLYYRLTSSEVIYLYPDTGKGSKVRNNLTIENHGTRVRTSLDGANIIITKRTTQGGQLKMERTGQNSPTVKPRIYIGNRK